MSRSVRKMEKVESAPQHILKQRLADQNQEMAELRQQQQAIVKLLGQPHDKPRPAVSRSSGQFRK